MYLKYLQSSCVLWTGWNSSALTAVFWALDLTVNSWYAKSCSGWNNRTQPLIPGKEHFSRCQYKIVK